MARKGSKSNAARARQAKSNALNKAYRAKAAALKKAGVLTSRVNARANITHSTRTKINKFTDVLEGRVAVVRAKPEIRRKYEGVLESRGPFLLVTKDQVKERHKIARGLVEIERPLFTRPSAGIAPLQFGAETEVILPFRIIDMQNLVAKLKTDESLDGLKRGNEQFAFRIDGWASKEGFANAMEMGEYIETHYAHLFKPGTRQKIIKYLTFVRYYNYVGNDMRLPATEHKGAPDKPWGKANAKGRSEKRGHSTGLRTREADKLRKQKQRAAKKEL